MNRMTDTVNADYVPIYGQSLIATALAVAPAACVMLAFPSSMPPLPLIGAAVGLGGAIWFAGLYVMRHPVATEIYATVQARAPGLLPRSL